MEYDVFISCKSEDYKYAEEIYNFLKENGFNTFLANKELRQMGDSEYRRAISQALKSTYHLIVFASNAEYIDSTWVYYEWDWFLEAKIKGKKQGQLLSILKDVNIDDVNADLWKYESKTFENYKESLLSYIETPAYLQRKKEAEEKARLAEEKRKQEKEAALRREKILKEIKEETTDYERHSFNLDSLALKIIKKKNIAPSFTEDYTRIPNKHIIPDANPQKERFGVELQINPKISFLSSRDPLKPIKDSASIFAPSEVSKNDFMIVQVFLYPWIEENLVLAKAKDVDPDAVRKNFTPLDVPLKNGDKVTAHLQMSGKGLELDETDIEMIWQDHYTDCQFSVYVPEDYKPQSVVGTVTLSVNGAPAGRMTFKSKIVDVPRLLYAEIVSHKFNKIFISYSHLDEDKVKFIHQAYEALKVDHFFDRAYLKPGDVYPEKIKKYIASADLFILCWSENAKNSDYVQLEIEDAMKRAYPGIDMDKATLAIHPLDIDPHAELPKEMNKVYNFGRI